MIAANREMSYLFIRDICEISSDVVNEVVAHSDEMSVGLTAFTGSSASGSPEEQTVVTSPHSDEIKLAKMPPTIVARPTYDRSFLSVQRK